jgi:cell division protein FtsB
LNTGWLLKSSTIWGALVASGVLSMLVLWFSPEGLRDLRKRQDEMRETKHYLLTLNRKNRELYSEVQRLAAKDPELMEALARRAGYAKPGETIYTFRDKNEDR